MLIEYLYSPFHHTCWFFFCATLFFQRLALTGETHLDGIAWLYGFDKTQAFQPVVSNDRTDTGIDKQTRSRRKHKIPMHHPLTENRLQAFNKPLIAAVNGYALGAGCELALLCDVVVAGENARFGLPEITLGIMPGAGGTQRLIRSVGKSLASKMVLSGESITAQQAQQAGLVSDVFPSDLTLEYALQLASKMARHSPLALQAAKQALRQSQEVALQAGLAQERQLFTLLAATEDRHEGISAFLQKRTPDFKGR